MNDTQKEIIETIQAIEEKKQELRDAEYIVEFNPRVINELELKLFNLIRENNGDDMGGYNNRFEGKRTSENGERVFY